MGIEIERKFLVLDDTWKNGVKGIPYRQGYMGNDPAATIRVRIAGDHGYLTLKSRPKTETPLSRSEFEYEIPVEDAERMLNELCSPEQIQKIRYRVPHEGLVWEVDHFLGQNTGLVVAEIELISEDQKISRPQWVGQEVSHDPRYSNAALAKYPYCLWKDGGHS